MKKDYQEYRVCTHKAHETQFFFIHNVHFNSLGEPMYAFDDPESPGGVTVGGLVEELEEMKAALGKPIIDLDNTEWAPLEYELEYKPNMPEKYLKLLVDQHIDIAFKEMAPVFPIELPEKGMWNLRHDLYPIQVEAHTAEETIERYREKLSDLIVQRFQGQLSPESEAQIKGRAGLNFQKLADEHLKTIALKELDPITPWYSEEDESWVYDCPLYPGVCFAGETKEEVIERYLQILHSWIVDRLKFKVAFPDAEGKAGLF